MGACTVGVEAAGAAAAAGAATGSALGAAVAGVIDASADAGVGVGTDSPCCFTSLVVDALDATTLARGATVAVSPARVARQAFAALAPMT
jgi:hypothetical protein